MTHPSDAADGSVPLEHVRVDLEVEIPSDIRYIERVVELVTRQCQELRFPASQCALNVPVALTEALSNAILRGNGEDPGKQVCIRAHVDPQRIVLDVVDEGRAFDIDQALRDPTLPENLERERGRGLFLMRKLMDRVERYPRDSRDGNIVRLTLRRK